MSAHGPHQQCEHGTRGKDAENDQPDPAARRSSSDLLKAAIPLVAAGRTATTFGLLVIEGREEVHVRARGHPGQEQHQSHHRDARHPWAWATDKLHGATILRARPVPHQSP